MSNKDNKDNNNFDYEIIFNKYLIENKIGKGSFGTVYTAINQETNERVAVKTEINNNKVQVGLLESESLRMNTLKGYLGIPKVYQFGKVKGFNILIMELLGKSLGEIFQSQNKKFSLKTICVLGVDMIKLIEHVHEKQYLHRDIKPDNFVMGRDKYKDVLYLIDFGLAKRYINSYGQHIPFKSGKSMTGTARYCSIYTHQGIEQSRRDDLESIGYVLLLFLKGSLPWQGLKDDRIEDKFYKIMEKKLQIPIEILCLNLPQEIVFYLKYVRSLRFEDKPDYDILRGFFITILYNCQGLYDLDKDYLKFDWTFDDINHIWDKYRNKGIDCIHHNLNSPKKCIICHSHLENNNRSSFSNQNIHNYNNNNNNSN